jgi:hypothetical protein
MKVKPLPIVVAMIFIPVCWKATVILLGLMGATSN